MSLLLLSIASASLTSNKLIFANGTYVYLLDKTLNTTASVNVGAAVNSVAVSQDGNLYIIASTASNVYTYNGALSLIHSAAITNSNGCTRYQDYYYCGLAAVDDGTSLRKCLARRFDLSGIGGQNYTNDVCNEHFGSASGATTVTVGSNGKVYTQSQCDNVDAAVTYVRAYYPANGTLIGYTAQASYATTPRVLYNPVYDEVIVSHNATTNAAFVFDVNTNGSTSYQGLYSASYALYPQKTLASSYLSANATGLYEFDGVTVYHYPFDLSSLNALKFAEYGSQSPSSSSVEVRSSASYPGCGPVQAVGATCQFQNGTNYFSVYASTDASTSDTLEIGAEAKSTIIGQTPTFTYARASLGYLKPHELCWWNENDEVVGGSGLNSLVVSKVVDNYISRSGFEVGLMAENYKWEDGLGTWHWHTGYKPAVWSDTEPGIMAGPYASPVIIDFIPSAALVDTTDMTFTYDIMATSLENWEYIDDFTENNMVWMALAMNTSHYQLYNITSNATKTNIQPINSGALTWAQLRTMLEDFDADMSASIDELLPLVPMDTQTYAYDSDTGSIKVYGYVWTSVKRGDYNVDVTAGDLSTNGGVYPICANNAYNNYSMFYYDEQAPFIKYSNGIYSYTPFTLSTVPMSTPITHHLNLFNFRVFPVLSAPTAENLYKTGTAAASPGYYNYTCVSDNGEIKTGSYGVYNSTQNVLVIQFNESAERNVGMMLNVRTRDNQPALAGTLCTFQSGTYDFTTSTINGTCYAYNLPKNSYVNVTVAYQGFSTKYLKYVNDAYNTERDGEGGFCTTFTGWYQYTVEINPERYDRTMQVTCLNYRVPNAEVFINGDRQGRTDSQGELMLQLTALTSPLTQGWDIDVVSEYGNDSRGFATFETDPIVFKMQNCNSTLLIGTGGTVQDGDLLNILALLLSPMTIGLVILLSISAGSIIMTGELAAGVIAVALGTILFTLLGIFPLIVLVILLLIVALGFAALIIFGGR